MHICTVHIEFKSKTKSHTLDCIRWHQPIDYWPNQSTFSSKHIWMLWMSESFQLWFDSTEPCYHGSPSYLFEGFPQTYSFFYIMIKEYICIMQPNCVVSEINRRIRWTSNHRKELMLNGTNERTKGYRVQMTPTKREKKPLQCNFLVNFEIQAYMWMHSVDTNGTLTKMHFLLIVFVFFPSVSSLLPIFILKLNI